jgi:deoxyribodipyrimidine photolyase
MNFLYRILTKLQELTSKKNIREKRNFLEISLEQLKLEQLKHGKTISVEQRRITK